MARSSLALCIGNLSKSPVSQRNASLAQLIRGGGDGDGALYRGLRQYRALCDSSDLPLLSRPP